MRLTALVSQKYGFAGSWQFGLFGLVVAGVRGATSYALSQSSIGNPATDIPTTCMGATSASLEEFGQALQQVVRRLVSSLLRSVGSHQVQEFGWLSL